MSRRAFPIAEFAMQRPVEALQALAAHGQDTPASGDDIARHLHGVTEE